MGKANLTLKAMLGCIIYTMYVNPVPGDGELLLTARSPPLPQSRNLNVNLARDSPGERLNVSHAPLKLAGSGDCVDKPVWCE